MVLCDFTSSSFTRKVQMNSDASEKGHIMKHVCRIVIECLTFIVHFLTFIESRRKT